MLLLLLSNFYCMAQDETTTNNSDTVSTESKKRFHAGLYIGSYIANNYTASIYDGYGFDIDGNKNDFLNSLMYQKIVMQYGGGYGQTDQIALALGVDHSDWAFNESDMPVNMHYTPAFVVGLNCRYSIGSKNELLLNVNAAKINVTGNFTIYTKPPSNSTQINNSIRTFPIIGSEKRLMLQLGYQRIIGNDDKFNFIVEGGLMATIVQADKNTITINNLQIDLTSYYNQAQNPSPYPVQKLLGVGLGAFAGAGVNITANPKWTLQALYNPSLENINIGVIPKRKLQHAIALRIYYNL